MAAIYVTNTNDSGAGSLRAAVEQADTAAGADTIKFDSSLSGATITLTSGIGIDSDVKIIGDVNGDGKADITVSGGNASQIFFMSSIYADTTIRSLNMVDGYSAGTGGAVYVYGDAKLKVVNSTINNSMAARGGAIGTMYGDITIVNSLIWNNTGTDKGGGIYLDQGKLTIVNSTLDENGAGTSGGGIFTTEGEVTLINSTVVRNYSLTTFDGGGITEAGNPVLTIVNSVVAGNNSKNGSDADITGTIDTAINSVFGSFVTITSNTNSVDFVQNVGLGDLLDNGGAVLSRAPLDGSILIDFGSDAELPVDTYDADNDGNTTEILPIDVRGLARILFDSVDVGAAEWTVDETIRGTDFGNLIFGGFGNDIVDGGAGNDKLFGEAGNDFMKGGGSNDVVDGGTGDDTLLGGGGNDRLAGAQGLDTLTGNLGSDTFVLKSTFANRDTITDFNPVDDTLEISAAEFGAGLAAGALPAARFVSNTTGLAGDANDRFIYNSDTGELFFDSNGTGAGGSRLIATFSNHAALTAADILIV